MKTTLVLISLALLGATGAAQAANCPRGQILLVSKHTCISREEAVKLGILHGAAGKAKPEASPEAAAPEQASPVRAEPAPEAPATDEQQAARAPSEPLGAPQQPRHIRAVKVAPVKIPAPVTAAPATEPAETSVPRAFNSPAPTAAAAPPPAASAPSKAEAVQVQAKTSPFGALDTGNVPVMSPAK